MIEIERIVDRALAESERDAREMKKRRIVSNMPEDPRRDRAEAFVRCLERLGYRIVPA